MHAHNCIILPLEKQYLSYIWVDIIDRWRYHTLYIWYPAHISISNLPISKQIQISSHCRFNHIVPALHPKIVRFLLHGSPENIAEEVYCHPVTIYRIQQNLFRHGTSLLPQLQPKDVLRTLTIGTEKPFGAMTKDQLWAQQNEAIWFLWEEWSFSVHQWAISRTLKGRQINRQWRSSFGILSERWITTELDRGLIGLTAEQLDETLFNEATGGSVCFCGRNEKFMCSVDNFGDSEERTTKIKRSVRWFRISISVSFMLHFTVLSFIHLSRFYT